MRTLAILSVLVACSVPDKHTITGDAGVPDSPPPSTVAVDTILTSQPAAFSPTGSAMFAFTSNVLNATFMCSVDGAAESTCQSPFVRSLADGPHTFSVRASDDSGNTDPTPAEAQWTIDTVPPDTVLTSVPPRVDNSVSVQFMFRATEDNVTFECKMDNGSYAACMSGDVFGPLAAGPHVFAVRATDRAGNVDATPASYAWQINTSAPDTEILSGPSGPTASTSASFTFDSPNAGQGATFQCSLDNAPFAACTSPFSVNNLAQRTHTFEVRVVDAGGNMDPTPAMRTWTVDLTPPDTTITSGPSGTVTLASASFTFASTETGSTFTCSLDGAPAAACTSPFTVMGLAQGPHTFSVRATDAAGNVDPTPATRSWSIDSVAPTVQITSGPADNSTSGPRVTFTFTVSDGAVACSLDSAPFAPCTSPVAFNAPAGPHQFSVRATDAAGNVATASRSWTIACGAPDTVGAAGLLHLDDGSGQTLANAVPGGAPAVLGNDMTVETADPSFVATARFGGGLAFTPSESDHASWPAMLGATSAMSIELWIRPDAPAGARNVFVTGDSRVAIQVTATSPSTVVISATIIQGNGTARTVSSAAVAAATWHYVLVSFAQPSLRMWVDGTRSERDDVQLGMTAPAFDALTLGGTGAAAYGGQMDEVWIAQTAITTDDAALQRYCPL